MEHGSRQRTIPVFSGVRRNDTQDLEGLNVELFVETARTMRSTSSTRSDFARCAGFVGTAFACAELASAGQEA